VATAHNESHAVTTDGDVYGYSLKDQIFSIHSHPNTNENYGSDGDQGVFTRKYNELGRWPSKHYVYHVETKTLIGFDSWKKSKSEKRIYKTKDYYDKGF